MILMLVHNPRINNFAKYLTPAMFAVTAIVLIAMHNRVVGYSLLAITCVVLLLASKSVQKHFYLIAISLAILGLVPINTDISLSHMFEMGFALSLAIAIPLFVTRRVYKEKTIRFPWHHGRGWYKHEILYIFITALAAYLILPFYFANTGAYLNWPGELGAWNLTKLFIGTNALGIWDELFFIATVLALLKRHLPFAYANIIQAVLFTSFLFELGFTGWAPFLIYPFALLQGLIFKKTESLLYVITIHLTLDLILYLALINAHHPNLIPIFITG